LSSRDPRDEARPVSSSGACSSERGMAVSGRGRGSWALSGDRHMITDTRHRAKHQNKIQCELFESVSIWCALFCKNKFRFELTPFRTKRNPM
jgi:hypothetical protein